jgi:hypothetical protein
MRPDNPGNWKNFSEFGDSPQPGPSKPSARRLQKLFNIAHIENKRWESTRAIPVVRKSREETLIMEDNIQE